MGGSNALVTPDVAGRRRRATSEDGCCLRWRSRPFLSRLGLTAACPGNNFGTALLPANPMPHTQTVNALRVHFRNWVMKGTPPPPSRYPTLAQGQLAEANKEAIGFPTLPGLRAGVPEPDFIADRRGRKECGAALSPDEEVAKQRAQARSSSVRLACRMRRLSSRARFASNVRPARGCDSAIRSKLGRSRT